MKEEFHDLKGKKLLVLGGARLWCEIITAAKDMGLYVAVTDYNEPENSPGKLIADESFMVSCTDVDGVVELIKREKFDGVITGFSDLLLPYYAEICEKSGLPAYATKEQLETFTNKDSYKKICKQYNVPTIPDYDIVDMNYDPSAIEFPVLLKPADGSGSKGLRVCKDNDMLAKAIQESLDTKGPGKHFIVERYLDTDEVMVYWLLDDGEYYVSAIANRHVKHIQGDDVIPALIGFTLPSSVTPLYLESIADNVKKMFRSQNLKNGMLFMQCKAANDQVYVFDIGYRPTGSLEYHVIEDICGYNTLQHLIHFAVTGHMAIDDRKVDPYFHNEYGFSVVGQVRPGKIAEITGEDQVKARPEIRHVYFEHVAGDDITEKMRGTLGQVVYRIHGTTGNAEDVFPMMENVRNTMKVVSDTGENMMLPGIEAEDLNGRILIR